MKRAPAKLPVRGDGGHGRLAAAATRFREWIRANPLLNTTWRIGVFTVGATVLLAGVAMLVLPGPGWAAIFVGFAVLATEFVWAQRALGRAKQAARKAKEKALAPEARRRNQIIAVVVGLLGGAATLWYLIVFGLNVPWAA